MLAEQSSARMTAAGFRFASCGAGAACFAADSSGFVPDSFLSFFTMVVERNCAEWPHAKTHAEPPHAALYKSHDGSARGCLQTQLEDGQRHAASAAGQMLHDSAIQWRLLARHALLL